ncbi:phage tail assembly chaperone [Pseudomonas protegens]|uniref:phage tail assembly chaperone n=1 Tax=Pseudomonas protegens TaxID=380021 RepID=UPI002761FA21|nr:phage tail assembly chaperone [Pseudomonas protegens]MDP9515223.1 phage tail assembly chaperone [Pseudomonas protegens]
MKRLYSKTTQTTYLMGIHARIPMDAIQISEALYQSVIGNPLPGQIRAHDEQGLPFLIDAPIVVQDFSSQERGWRDENLMSVIWLRERHRDQLEIKAPTSLDSEQFNTLLVYIQALRDWPQSANFPTSRYRPVAPSWITEQTQ